MSLRTLWSGGNDRIRRARAREFALFTGSMVLFQGARFLFSLAAARSLAPEDFTAWAIVVSLLVYAPSLLFGIANGMSREVPILIGQGLEGAADRCVAAAWTAALAAVITIFVGAVATVAAAPTVAPYSLLVGILTSGSIVFSTQQAILRSRLNFDAASAQQATYGALVAITAVLLTAHGAADFSAVAGLYGAALIGTNLVGMALSRPVLAHSNIREMRRLAKIGFPILLVGLLFSLLVTLDRWMAVTLLGPENAAPYALASLTAAAMLVVPTVVSQQTYPRMAIARGSGAGTAVLRSMARRQGLMAAGLVVPVAVAVDLFAWVGFPRVLPLYAEAAPAVVILSVGFIVLGYLTGYGNYLNVVGGQWRYFGAQLVGLSFAVGIMFAGGRLLGLLGIALGMSLSYFVYGLVLREVAMRTELISAEPISAGGMSETAPRP